MRKPYIKLILCIAAILLTCFVLSNMNTIIQITGNYLCMLIERFFDSVF